MFDCPIFLQALLGSSGPAFACLELVESGSLTLYLSREVFAEVAEVLYRPGIRKGRVSMDQERLGAFPQHISQMAVFLDDVPTVFTYPRDPKDEPYVSLAIAAGAKFLVTRDRDLLDLMDRRREEARVFQIQFPSLTILDPVSLLRELSHQVKVRSGAISD